MAPHHRKGCLSWLNIGLALATLLSVFLWVRLRGASLFSPGPLQAAIGPEKGGVRSHAEITACGRCHAPFWSPLRMADRCLHCHTDIRQEFAHQRGLHGALATSAQAESCRDCHTEHRGPNASLTRLDLHTFPHDSTGFSLQAHAPVVAISCADCHPQNFAAFSPQPCISCHTEEDAPFMNAHRQAFGDDCLACHDGVDRFTDFSHQATGFALQGAHNTVACSSCHEQVTTWADFQKVGTTCFACHQQDDPHAGTFGQRCETCHQPTTWKEAIFAHEETGFPLVGGHDGLQCQACHGEGDFTQPLAAACASCHAEPSYHAGLFSGPCENCHTNGTWRPANYDAAAHTFPLRHGNRTPNACQVCHPATLTDYTCYGCHEHTPSGIAREHREEGIVAFENCVRCHPTGREDEAEDD